MSSGALREVFAAFGFEFDFDALERADAAVKRLTATESEAARAHAAQVAERLRAQAEVTAAQEEASRPREGATAEASIILDPAFAEEVKKVEGELAKVEAGADKAADKADKLGSKAAKLGTLKDALSKIHPAFGVLADKVGIGGIELTQLTARAAGAIGVVAGLAAGAYRLAEAFAADAAAVRDTSRALQVSTSDLVSFRHAAEMSGVGSQRMESALGALHTRLENIELRRGGSGILRRLGVDARDASGHIRPATDVMADLAVAMDRIPSPIRRARVAQQLFGAEGRRMLDVLHGGAGGLAAYRDEVAALGGGTLPEAVAAAGEFSQAQQRMRIASESVRSVVATSILPVFTWLTEKVALVTGWWSRMTRGTQVVRVAMHMLGVVGAAAALALIAAWAPVVAPVVLFGIGVAAAILVVEDFIGMMNGGDSAIGAFIDSIFGVGAATEVIETLKEAWENVVGLIERAIALVARLTVGAPSVAVGTLRPPQFGPPQELARRAIAARRGQGGTEVTIPASRAVVAPSRVAGGASGWAAASRATSNTFNISTQDPRAAAREAMRLMEQRQRQARDATASRTGGE